MRINKQSLSATFMETECPECCGIARISEDWTQSFSIVECPYCGYNSFHNEQTEEKKVQHGYGSVYIEYKNRPYFNLIFDKLPSETEIQSYMRLFDDPFIIKERSYFYVYNNAHFNVMYGSKPQSFNDWVKEQQMKMEYEKELYSHRNYNVSSEDCTIF